MAEFRDHPLYICKNCRNPLALQRDLLSKDFWGKSGPAYLFSHAMNIIVGRKEDRKLITGAYSVADIYCCNCGEILGWKYLRVYEVKQKFKEGKFIIETAKIAREY
ncbi:protein yippee-like At4g27740 isoform X2 [Carya illinoinensis]|uniref:protein yippee-like At4g27740 isoform X2 n=1 Tax=Carya illinoinensis TaxID=32201 RepID=UPI001C7219F1|nr:protein yippee-like At4g27740 isoform X2 [Carya illinoinensis]